MTSPADVVSDEVQVGVKPSAKSITCWCAAGEAMKEVPSLSQTTQQVPLSAGMENTGNLSLKKLAGKSGRLMYLIPRYGSRFESVTGVEDDRLGVREPGLLSQHCLVTVTASKCPGTTIILTSDLSL